MLEVDTRGEGGEGAKVLGMELDFSRPISFFFSLFFDSSPSPPSQSASLSACFLNSGCTITDLGAGEGSEGW